MVKILKTWDVHGDKVALPDQSQFSIEGTKLEEVKERLAKRGLKSPWLRNAAWRYHPEWHYQRVWPSFFRMLFRGFPYAVAILGVSIVGTELYNRAAKPEEHHFHGYTPYVPKPLTPKSADSS